MVRSDVSALHVPGAEIWLGTRTPGTEVVERVAAIEEALTGWPLIDAVPHDDAWLYAVHDPGLIAHLRTIWDRWEHSERVVPYLFPTAGMLGDLPLREPTAAHAAAGRWCYDTMTLIGPGTWEAARAAIDVALTAVDHLAEHRVVYALTRPPGHHVTRSAYGGSCYLNNAAVAAHALVSRSNGTHRGLGTETPPGTHARVAVVDIDAHHGNGTQDIFYNRADVLYASVHVDPGSGWFPHYSGFADEQGIGDGIGTTMNLPLEPGSGDMRWLDAVMSIVQGVMDFGAESLVLSLGVDAAIDDPESPLEVTRQGYHRAGELLGALELPTVVVQEGGYHLPTLGSLVRATLQGLGA